LGHSLQGPPSGKSSHVRCDGKTGSQFRGPFRVESGCGVADLGGTALVGSPADFGKLIIVEAEKWAKVVKFSGAKPG